MALADDSRAQLSTLVSANARLVAENSVLQSYLARHASVRRGRGRWG